MATKAPSYYTARSEDELQRIAQQQYQSYYDQLRTAATQKQQREALALENQRAGIQRSYQQQLDESAKQYRQAYSQADRETLRRGMQRSSYAAQRLANVNQEGIEAGQRIREAQTGAEGNLDAQIAQTEGQLADTLAGYDAGQAADVMKRYNELQSEEYDRAREAAQYAESIRQWQAQFNESKRQFNVLHGGGGGGGSGSSGGSTSRPRRTPTTDTPETTTDDSAKDLADSLLSDTGASMPVASRSTGGGGGSPTIKKINNRILRTN